MTKIHFTVRNTRGLLDWLEMMLMIFFLFADSTALIVLIAPKGNAWIAYFVVVLAVLLSIIWIIKFWMRNKKTTNDIT